MTTDRTETLFVDALRDAGLRLTMPRRAIIRVLVESDTEFLTASMILDAVSDGFSEIDASTIYRTLEELERIGLVHHVHLGSKQPGTWHVTVDRDHQHLLCENCGKTIEVPVEDLDATYDVLRTRYQFHPNTHHFTILGFCNDCVELFADQKTPSNDR